MSVWQVDALRVMLISPKHRKRLLPVLSPSDFEDPAHRWIYEVFITLLGDDKATKKKLKLAIKSDHSLSNVEQQKEIWRFGKELLAMDDDGEFDFLVNLIRKKRVDAARLDAALAVAEAVREGRDPTEEFRELSRLNVGDGEDEFKIINPLATISERLEERKEEKERGGILEFDDGVLRKLFPMGIAKKEMAIIVGPTNVGKSLVAQDMLLRTFIEAGMNVIYVVTENSEAVSGTRFDAQLASRIGATNEGGMKFSYQDLYFGNVSTQERDVLVGKYQELEDDDSVGSVRIAKVVPYRTTINTIEMIIDTVEEELATTKGEEDSKVDVVIIDSPEHMISTRRFYSDWKAKAAVYEDIKRMIDERDLIVMTTAQRKGNDAELFKSKKSQSEYDSASVRPNAEQVAGSREIARIADHIIGIAPPSDIDIQRGRVRVWLTKARNEAIPEYPVDAYRDPFSLEITWIAYEKDDGLEIADNVEEDPFSNEKTDADTNSLDTIKLDDEEIVVPKRKRGRKKKDPSRHKRGVGERGRF